MPPSAAAIARDVQFNWEGKDKKGNKIRGKILAPTEQAARADLRRQNIVPTKVSKHRQLFGGGGKITPGTPVSEQYLLDLEREAFLSLCGEAKTQERIAFTLKTGKPLRN